MKISYRILGISFVFLINLPTSSAQKNVVNIDYSIQRFIGSESTLDRSKYFKMHSNSEDAEFNQLDADYNVSIGRGFWGAFSYAKSQTGSIGVYPAGKSGTNEVKAVKYGYVATEHPYNVATYSLDVNTAGDWAVEYYKDYVSDTERPEYFEPMNEPFVHAGDDDFNDAPDDASMRLKMAQIYNAVGQKIHAAPELANMKVIGYSSAWPSMELWDFDHWETRMKMFMDEAGANMDGLATHLYDGINVSGQDNRRSGSNSEAILDLIETYSFAKWGTIKPHAISEYGGIESGYGDAYSDIKSIQSIKSINHILFNLLERQDRLLFSIPFITGKAEWHITAANNYEPYGAVLWKPTVAGVPVDADTEWEYTARVRFYQLWSEVTGDRVHIKSNNPDIQVQAFVDGTKLFVALNNLDDQTQTVDLNMIGGLAGLQNVKIKSLEIYTADDPVYQELTYTSAPTSIQLVAGETSILEYTFGSDITYSNSVTSKNYYSIKNVEPILAGQAITYNFNTVDIGAGDAMLKLSIGRKHDKSKSPVVVVNGTTVSVPDNWKGYDQSNRDDFFGTIEIPVSMDYLLTDNTVTITFPDSDGHVSSVILNVSKCTSGCDIELVLNDCETNTYQSGTWSLALENGQDVIIDDNYTLTTDLEACDLTINADKSLTVDANSTLDLTGKLNIETANQNIYTAGNMDSGQAGWAEWGSWNGVANAPRNFTEASARTGTYGLQVDFTDTGESQWTLSTAGDARFGLVSGVTYTFSFWAKTLTNSGKNIQFAVHGVDYSSTINSGQFNLTDEWQQFTFDGTASENKDHMVVMNFQQNKSVAEDGTNAESFYIDDIQVLDPTLPTKSGELIINSGSSLLTYAEDGNNVAATIKRNTRFSNGQYSFVGSPVKTDPGILGQNLGSTSYSYDETTAYGADGLARWKEASNTQLMPGVGYAQAFQKDLVFDGIPNDGEIVVTGLSHTDVDANHEEHGWSLLSNPYPASIDLESFLSANTNIDGFIAIWDDGGSNIERRTNADYLTVNALGSTNGASGSNDYTGPNSSRFKGEILSGQGFFARITSPSGNESVSFTESMRVIGNNEDESFFRKNGNSDEIKLKIGISDKKNNNYNEILVGFTSDATKQVDRLYDALKLKGNNNLNLYSLIGGQKYAIQGLPLLNEVSTEIGFESLEGDSLEITVREILGLKENMSLQLFDRVANQSYNLMDTRHIHILSQKGSDANRFVLTYVDNFLQDQGAVQNEIYCQIENNLLSVNFSIIPETTIEYLIYDMSGRITQHKKGVLLADNNLIIPMNNEGISILKIVADKQTFVRKFAF
ncbi:MAG: carbohydrate binding domain-containing protein [Reichenbachiella sp.]